MPTVMKHSLSSLWDRFSKTPELAKFRRYFPVWSWFLYSQTTGIEIVIRQCNNAIAESWGVAPDKCTLRLTDEPLSVVLERYPCLQPKVDELRDRLRHYGKDLLMVHEIMNLPMQHEIYARDLADTEFLFDGNVFGPTLEHANVYTTIPSDPDTCCVKGFNAEAHGPGFVLGRLRPISEWLRGSRGESKSNVQHFMRHETIQATMLVLAALYASVLLAGSLGVLSCLKSEGARIAVLGVFAFTLGVSLVVLIPNIRPSDLVVIIATYFAVGGVYIGAKGSLTV
ncbi:hypothetical protein BKA63DRAFT_565064 [Paraphoma chrysanthemicola]|nr:hypothetical protein BKA63DRAFT_565064 [Paraphoma chrysanthemicola]